MPTYPPGEADLRALARRFADAERRVRALLARAPEGDRRQLLSEALTLLGAPPGGPPGAGVRGVPRRLPCNPGGDVAAVEELAGSLALKLDRGAQKAAESAREAFVAVTAENLEETAAAAVTAHVGADGTRWALGPYAEMQTQTIGRQASTRGTADAVGDGKVIVEVGEVRLLRDLRGEAVVGIDALPPFHPNCSCVVSAA